MNGAGRPSEWTISFPNTHFCPAGGDRTENLELRLWFENDPLILYLVSYPSFMSSDHRADRTSTVFPESTPQEAIIRHVS